MRFADNFNPEWGYLAPAPSFMRTARIALVAAAIGAISGAGVVFSLIDRPAAEETSIAARTLVQQSDSAFVARIQRRHNCKRHMKSAPRPIMWVDFSRERC